MNKIVAFFAGLLLTTSAFSAILAETVFPGGRITLTNERGPCPEPFTRALFESKDGKSKVAGCYAITIDYKEVHIFWDDGDKDFLPTNVFKQLEGA